MSAFQAERHRFESGIPLSSGSLLVRTGRQCTWKLGSIPRQRYTYFFLMKVEVNSINIARLLSELEGCYIFTKYMGFEDDMNTIDEMKKRYYKLYFKLHKEEKSNGA